MLDVTRLLATFFAKNNHRIKKSVMILASVLDCNHQQSGKLKYQITWCQWRTQKIFMGVSFYQWQMVVICI